LVKAWRLNNARRERRQGQEKVVLPLRRSRSGLAACPEKARRSSAFLGSQQIPAPMNPIKPLSLKIRPEIRSRLKQVAYRMEWSEHQLAKNVLEATLDRIERNDSTALDRLIHLSRTAADFAPVSATPTIP
jgi:hypothetical protein